MKIPITCLAVLTSLSGVTARNCTAKLTYCGAELLDIGIASIISRMSNSFNRQQVTIMTRYPKPLKRLERVILRLLACA